jgi:hypothetical protein
MLALIRSYAAVPTGRQIGRRIASRPGLATLHYSILLGAPPNPHRAAIAATLAVDFGVEFREQAVRRSAEPGTARARPGVRA